MKQSGIAADFQWGSWRNAGAHEGQLGRYNVKRYVLLRVGSSEGAVHMPRLY